MASVNKVILIGNVGRDPEVFRTNNSLVANVNLATTDVWIDRNTGERKQDTEWHRLVFFGKTAEIVQEYVRAGTPLFVEGKIKTNKWKDKNTGEDRYSTNIQVLSMQMLGGNNASRQGSDQQQRSAQSTQVPRQRQHAVQDNSYNQAKQGDLMAENEAIPF